MIILYDLIFKTGLYSAGTHCVPDWYRSLINKVNRGMIQLAFAYPRITKVSNHEYSVCRRRSDLYLWGSTNLFGYNFNNKYVFRLCIPFYSSMSHKLFWLHKMVKIRPLSILKIYFSGFHMLLTDNSNKTDLLGARIFAEYFGIV